MEYKNKCDQEAADDKEKTKPVTDSEIANPDARFLQLSDSKELMSIANNKGQCCSEKDNVYIPVPKSEANADRLIHGDVNQSSAMEKHCDEKPKFNFNSYELKKDKSPNSSPTKTHQDPDTKELLNNVMIAANDDFSREDSDYSSASDIEETQLKKPLKKLTCSPSSTDEKKFCDDKENTIPDDCPILVNDHSLRQLNHALSDLERPKIKWLDPRNMPDESLTDKPAIHKFQNFWDLRSLSSENKINVESGVNTGSCLPDDEFMEADRYIGDKGKQPASKRYAYKKRSKSTVNQLTIDSENGTNKIMECGVKTDDQSCSYNELPPIASENEITCPVPNESSSVSHFIPEEFKNAEIQWNFHDYAQKLESSVAAELNISTDINSNNNNIYLFRIQNYFDYQISEEDANLQEGLLMSLQSINTSQNDDDSDVDVIN